MKRLLVLLMIALLILTSVVGCSDKPEEAPKTDMPTTSDGSKEEPAEQPTEESVKESAEEPAEEPTKEPAGEPTKEPVVSESTLEGERHEAENFTVIAPEGWQVTELYGGLQIARSGAELIRISFTGFNQAEDHAKQQVEHMSKSNSDSKVEEIEILGKTFWTTIYKTASGSERGYYARIEDGGVMLKIETVNGSYKTHKEFTDIIDSIVFK